MEKNQQLFTIENFKFTIFDSVPQPDTETAYILFKEGSNDNNLLVITSQNPTLGAQIRAGGFNKKVIMSLAKREIQIKREVADETNNFKFIILGNVIFRVKDAEFVYVNQLQNIEAVISDKINDIIDVFHKKYDIESQIELENEFRSQIKEKLEKLIYLEFTNITINVDVDERAKKIIDSNLNTMANSVLMQNQGEIESLEIEQKKLLDIKKLEAEKIIEEKKKDVILEKVKGVNAVKEKVGEEYATFLAYAKGEINSIQFEERLQHNANVNMMAKIAALKEIVDLDVLPGPALEKAAMRLLGEDSSENEIEQDELNNDIITEDAEEY